MPRPRTSIVVLLAAALGACLLPGDARACDAPPSFSRDPEGRFHEHDVVARGTVVGTRSIYAWDGERWLLPDPHGLLFVNTFSYAVRIVVDVEEAWTPVGSDRLILYEDGNDSCCDMANFIAPGEEVLVYARRVDGLLVINGWCSPILPIARAQDDLAWLGPGERSFRPHWRSDWGLGSLLGSLLALLLPLALVGGYLIARRRGS